MLRLKEFGVMHSHISNNLYIRVKKGRRSMEINKIIALEKQFVIGMVHCLPLPGTTGFDGHLDKIYTRAVQDAVTLQESGVDAIIVENMGD